MKTFLEILTNVWLGWLAFGLLEALWKRVSYSILWPMPRARSGLTRLERMTSTAARSR
jgi:hypothetical protein